MRTYATLHTMPASRVYRYHGLFLALLCLFSSGCLAGTKIETAIDNDAVKTAADFWALGQAGRITHDCTGQDPLVMCMQGRRVVMQVQADRSRGFSYKARFFNLLGELPPTGFIPPITFDAGPASAPEVRVDDQPLKIELPSSAAFDGLLSLTYPNLFDSHPPFQIDGNFGATAGFCEMLVQSHAGRIHLLPALPKAWSSGKVTGLCARGGFDVDMSWDNGHLTKAVIHSKSGLPCRVICGDKTWEFNTSAGKSYPLALASTVDPRRGR